MADSPTMTDMSTRYTMNFAGRVLYTDVGSQQFVETVTHNNTNHILKSHGHATLQPTYIHHAMFRVCGESKNCY